MPEIPDLVYIEEKLSATLVAKQVTVVAIKEPIVLRLLVAAPFDETLVGRKVRGVQRHGPFITIEFNGDKLLVIHPMLAGRFQLSEPAARVGRGLCFTLQFDHETALHYLDDKRMGKVYLISAGEQTQIPRYCTQGVNILSGAFTLEVFQQLIRKTRKQVRVFLMDQAVLSAIGNAYADEILHAAGLHPKTLCSQLTQVQIAKLYDSIIDIMKWGIAEVAKANQPIEVKVRGHMRVRNRKDQPCTKCGDTVRRAGVLGFDAFFCPTCQPPARKQFIQWSPQS